MEPWEVKKSDKCAVQGCKDQAETKIATSREEGFSYVPLCKAHNDAYLKQDVQAVRTVEDF